MPCNGWPGWWMKGSMKVALSRKDLMERMMRFVVAERPSGEPTPLKLRRDRAGRLTLVDANYRDVRSPSREREFETYVRPHNEGLR